MPETTNDASEATELNEKSKATSAEPTAEVAAEVAAEATAEVAAEAAAEVVTDASEEATADALPDAEGEVDVKEQIITYAAPVVDGEDDIPAEPTTFRVSNRLEEKVIDGRLEAVAAAKEWSIETGQSIVVERTDGRIQMGFRDGALVDYVLETRKGRRA